MYTGTWYVYKRNAFLKHSEKCTRCFFPNTRSLPIFDYALQTVSDVVSIKRFKLPFSTTMRPPTTEGKVCEAPSQILNERTFSNYYQGWIELRIRSRAIFLTIHTHTFDSWTQLPSSAYRWIKAPYYPWGNVHKLIDLAAWTSYLVMYQFLVAGRSTTCSHELRFYWGYLLVVCIYTLHIYIYILWEYLILVEFPVLSLKFLSGMDGAIKSNHIYSQISYL